jgi:bifunctional aspartokinase / homoserine dehydrogenase 1
VDIEMPNWEVHKFGGTSLGCADYIRKCINIIKDKSADNYVAMIVSAMGGKPKVTDMLLDAVYDAANGDEQSTRRLLNEILRKHTDAIVDLLPDSPSELTRLTNIIKKDISDIRDILKGVGLMRIAHEAVLELVSGYGEIWSARVIAATMKYMELPFEFLNARECLVVRSDDLFEQIYWEMSKEKLTLILKSLEEEKGFIPNLVITGYVASTDKGLATTLKRDGSDFSASIFGMLLNSKSVTIWTDVSGVYSADPRRVPDAQVIQEISYSEAIELAYFGAKVIHPKTMNPAIRGNFPIYIKNTFDPHANGTRIYAPPRDDQSIREKCVCGFSTVDNVALLNIDGTGMIGVSGISARVFQALEESGVSVLFIAQASSEHSICFATKMDQADQAKQAIETKFYWELEQGLISKVDTIMSCSIIAAVGDSMSNMPGVSGVFFSALGNAKINILSISQGMDERNISAVVLQEDSARALQVVHSAFWLSSHNISIGLVGTGQVGSAVVQTLLEQAVVLLQRFHLKLRICAVANAYTMQLGDDLSDKLKGKLHVFAGAEHSPMIHTTFRENSLSRTHSNLSLEDLADAMDAQEEGIETTNLDKLLDHVMDQTCSPHYIMIDCTDSLEVGALHPKWIRRGAHVVTANKYAVTRSLDLYNDILQAVKKTGRLYFSEVTLGSSVPILTTLNDILVSGDAIHGVVGIMNVCCQTILSLIMDGVSLAEALKRVHDLNLMEKDPWFDLSGQEAASKILVLARAMGLPMNMEDIVPEPLIEYHDGVDFSDVNSTGVIFAKQEEKLRQKVAAAKAKNCTLRYVQRLRCTPPVETGVVKAIKWEITVKMEEVSLESDLAIVKGPIYFFSFHTERYKQSPLCIKGPLSDSSNSASGIVGDILRIARAIGVSDKGQSVLKKSIPSSPP